MKKATSYLVSGIFSMFFGAACMYLVTYYYPNSFTKTINTVEKNVTVNENGISDGIDNVYDSVVVVENYKKGKLTGIGSGFVYDEKGYIMTNHHVIDDATEVKVIMMNGESLNATVLGSDEYADIAVIQIDSAHVSKVAKLGNNESTKLGDTVFTIGSPMSSEFYGTVTRGILSGKNRMVEVSINSSTSDWIMNVMQTDAAINPGNSGGPLCNVSGEVIGVNSMKIVQSEIEGLGFAIPIEEALIYANMIIKGEKVQRAYLGIRMSDRSTSDYYLLKEGIKLDPSITTGVIVIETVSGGPCDKGGLKKGDVITKIGDYSVKNIAELRYYLFKYKPNEKVNIDVIRGTEIQTFNVTLGVSE